jgi:hypothetical protein
MIFKLDSLAALDSYVLDVLTLKLVARAHNEPLHTIRKKIWYPYLDSIARFLNRREAVVELPIIGATDSLEIAMITGIEAGNTEEAPFWTEVAAHMSARPR